MIRHIPLVLASLFAFVGISSAQDATETTETPAELTPPDPEEYINFTVYWENDAVMFKPNNDTDRNYTNGTALELSHQPKWAEAIAPYVPFAKEFGPARTAAGYTLGQLMFTPKNLRLKAPIKDDWPYVGYLYGGIYWERLNDITLDHLQLDLGVIGQSSQAGNAQKLVHDWINDVHPEGWGNQQDDEFTAQFHLRKTWRFDLAEPSQLEVPNPDRLVEVQLIPQIGTSMGTVTRSFDGDVTLRVGLNLPDDFGPSRLSNLTALMSPPPNGLHFYGFARLGGRVVLHNEFLEARNFSQDEETLVGEVQAGLALGYNWDNFTLAVDYSQTYLTREFEDQNRPHSYGAWVVSFIWNF